MQSILQLLWTKFVEEVLPHLQKYSKWPRPEKDYREGDLVVVFQTYQNTVWPVGKITRVYRSELDGVVRKVDVLYAGKIRLLSINSITHFMSFEEA